METTHTNSPSSNDSGVITNTIANSNSGGGNGYVFLSKLGVGSFATVYKGHRNDRPNEIRAIKAISKSKLNRKLQENIESEIGILQKLNHTHIVRLFEIQVSEKHIYLELEYCAGGDLHKLLRKHGNLSTRVAQRLMKQLSSGMHFLYQHNFVHRDLKPQNLLLSSKNISLDFFQDREISEESENEVLLKIADFGFARHLAVSSMAETLCGSPLYMAPEILRYRKYDAKADLWSAGTILFEMLVGQPPFTGQNPQELLRNIERTELRIPSSTKTTPTCVQLLRALLRRNPLERISFEEYFDHPFLNSRPMSVLMTPTHLPITLVQEEFSKQPSLSLNTTALSSSPAALAKKTQNLGGNNNKSVVDTKQQQILQPLSQLSELQNRVFSGDDMSNSSASSIPEVREKDVDSESSSSNNIKASSEEQNLSIKYHEKEISTKQEQQQQQQQQSNVNLPANVPGTALNLLTQGTIVRPPQNQQQKLLPPSTSNMTLKVEQGHEKTNRTLQIMESNSIEDHDDWEIVPSKGSVSATQQQSNIAIVPSATPPIIRTNSTIFNSTSVVSTNLAAPSSSLQQQQQQQQQPPSTSNKNEAMPHLVRAVFFARNVGERALHLARIAEECCSIGDERVDISSLSSSNEEDKIFSVDETVALLMKSIRLIRLSYKALEVAMSTISPSSVVGNEAMETVTQAKFMMKEFHHSLNICVSRVQYRLASASSKQPCAEKVLFERALGFYGRRGAGREMLLTSSSTQTLVENKEAILLCEKDYRIGLMFLELLSISDDGEVQIPAQDVKIIRSYISMFYRRLSTVCSLQ